MSNRKIPASDEAWDDGSLGRSEAHVKRYELDINAQLDEALELQPISIRLQKGLLENLKHIATLNGIGYQPLVRQVLSRFVQAEVKMLLREKASELQQAKKSSAKRVAPSEAIDVEPTDGPKRRKAA